jgi:hypothetical protein
MVVGGLVATLCGTCTLFFVVAFMSPNELFRNGSALILPILIGGIPTFIGVLVFRAGLRRWRRARRPDPSRQFE